MRAYIDRIEDGEIAVVQFVSSKNRILGQIEVPKKELGIEIREGMYLDVSFVRDQASEISVRDRITQLQNRLSAKTVKKKSG